MPPSPDPTEPIASPFPGDSEMAARCRALDWSATSLGAPEGWPAALRTVVRTCLESPFPLNLWCGPELVLVYNDAYRRVLGAKHPRALGRPGLEVWGEIRGELEPMFAQVRAGGPPVYAEDARFVMVRAEGVREGADAYFTFGLSPVRDEAGTIVAFLNPAAETTGRVLAEQRLAEANRALEVERGRLAAVFRQAPTFLAVLRGEAHVFELANDAYFQLVGRRDLLGRPLHDALPELRGQGFDTLLDHVLHTGEPYVGREVPVMLANTPGAPPEPRYVDFVYLPLVEADGSRSGVIAHGSDVTDHVRARQVAEEANRTKSAFLANMSHELRTPLNAIQGHLQLLDMLLHGPLTPEQRATLGRIDRAQRHLQGLIDDILGYARLESGRVEYDVRPTRVGDVVQDVLPIVEPLVVARGLRLELPAPEPDASTRVLADAEKLAQVLVNLLSNAVKFTPGGGRIAVVLEAGEGVARLHVRDSGVGIPADKLEAIFEPFVQVRNAYSPGQGGTGLGLAISRDLARGMGGELLVESTPGAGSTFTVVLPLAGA